jgi:hypothetical protein
MRNILMVGTADAEAPYADGVQAWVPEGAALALFATGELEFQFPADEPSDLEGRRTEILAAQTQKAVQAWANVRGSASPARSPYGCTMPPDGTQRAEDVIGRCESPRYG